MKQLKINIDIDNTVNDFIEKFVHFCNEMRPTENQFYVDAMMEYSLEKDTNINDSVLSTLFFKNPSFYKQLKPLKDAEWVIENINKDHTVKFVTSIDYDVIDARIQFINRYFPSVDIGKQLLVTDDKHSIYADIVVDDYIKHMNNVNPNCKFLLYDQPWNRNFNERIARTDVKRVFSWEEVYKYITEITYF